jgi:hypothetical protein
MLVVFAGRVYRASASPAIAGVPLRCRELAVWANCGLFRCSNTALLFDDLVGNGEPRWRHGQTEPLGRLEVKNQFVLGRRLHR